MRLCIQREFQLASSMVGRIWIQAGSGPKFSALSLERNWDGNRAGKSCVPAGFYYLEPHHGTKYQDTYALIGEYVSHEEEPGVPRYACVAHNARTGEHLQGCFAVGEEIHLAWPANLPPVASLHDPVVDELLEILRSTDEKHYITIADPPRIDTRIE